MTVRMTVICAGLIALVLYVLTLAGGPVDNGDSGEFLAVAATFGVAHPPGYPTYTLLAAAAYHLPLPGFDAHERVALVAALSAALAVALLCRMLLALGCSTVAAMTLALLAGLNALVWGQAVMAEVYTLHLLFFTGVLALAWRLARPAAPWLWGAAGLWCGLGLGNHVTLLFILPVLWWQGWHAPRRRHALALLTTGTLLALCVYLYLPWAAARDPYCNWGDPSTLTRFIDHVTLAQFRGDAWQWSRLPLKLTVLGDTLLDGAGIVALALAGLGSAALWRRARALTVALFAYVLLLVAAFGQGRAEVLIASLPVHLLPAVLATLLLAGAGLAALQSPRLRTLLTAALLVWLLVQIPVALRTADRHGDRILTGLAARLLHSCPQGGMLLVERDDVTFPLWALQAEGLRTDVLVVNGTLLNFPWYRDQMARRAGLTEVPGTPQATYALLAASAPAVYAFPATSLALSGTEKGMLTVLKGETDRTGETRRLLGVLLNIDPAEFDRVHLTETQQAVRRTYVRALNQTAIALAQAGHPARGMLLLDRAFLLLPDDRVTRGNAVTMRRQVLSLSLQ